MSSITKNRKLYYIILCLVVINFIMCLSLSSTKVLVVGILLLVVVLTVTVSDEFNI